MQGSSLGPPPAAMELERHSHALRPRGPPESRPAFSASTKLRTQLDACCSTATSTANAASSALLKMSRIGSTRVMAASPAEHDGVFHLHLPGPDGLIECQVRHELTYPVGQHMLCWPSVDFCWSSRTETARLEAGSCNLYQYPAVVPEGLTDDDAVPLRGKQLRLLDRLIIALNTPHSGFMELTDSAGAPPYVGLLVANTDAAVSLCVRIFEARPELMPVPHAVGSIFEGENALHVLAVNRREKQMIYLLELASESLDRPACELLVNGHARGGFFNDPPMDLYGTTIFAYAVAFSLHRAVAAMILLSIKSPVMKGLVSHAPQDPTQADPTPTQPLSRPLSPLSVRLCLLFSVRPECAE